MLHNLVLNVVEIWLFSLKGYFCKFYDNSLTTVEINEYILPFESLRLVVWFLVLGVQLQKIALPIFRVPSVSHPVYMVVYENVNIYILSMKNYFFILCPKNAECTG